MTDQKVSLLDMVRWAEAEAERTETWRRVLRSEGQDIDPGVARNGLIARRVTELLDLALVHRDEFRALVARWLRDAAAASQSTEPSSAESTTDMPPKMNGGL
jgi:hypothetical protein